MKPPAAYHARTSAVRTCSASPVKTPFFGARGGADSFFLPQAPLQLKQLSRGGAPGVQRQEAPRDHPLPVIPRLELHGLGTPPSSVAPDYLSMRRPFLDRHIYNLWDPDSALQVWQFNFDFFHRLGITPDLSATLSNLTTPRFIDAQLKAGSPTWWEITDQQLHTSTIMGSLPLLEFNADFSVAAPSWLKFILPGKKSKGP